MRQTIPLPRIRLIERHRLLRALDDWHELSLIRITAPAGFGKTTLAAVWLEQLTTTAGDAAPAIAWLSLSSEDDERAVLMQHIGEALCSITPALAGDFALESAGRLAYSQLLRMACAALGALERHVILVFDDCHLLRSAAALDLLQKLLDAAAQNLHIVLLSRETPPLNVIRLRLQGKLLDLVETELCLNHDEFADFVRNSGLKNLDPEQLREIEHLAAGWIAGLQMLSLAQHRRERFPNEERPMNLVAEFMEAEVFGSLRRELRTFLLDVALLPWITPESAAAVTGRSEAQCNALLQEAITANAFVTPLAMAQMLTCRCHPLFQEFLQHKLHQERTSAQIRRQRLSTAAWLGAHGELDEALSLLQPTGARQEMAALVASAVRQALLRMDLAAVRRWLARLPADVVNNNPQLAIDSAWLAYLSDAVDMCAQVTIAHHALANAEPGTVADYDELRTELGALSAICLLIEGKLPAARQKLQEAARIPHRAAGFGAGYLHLLNSYAPIDASDANERIRSLIRGEQAFESIGFNYGCIEAVVANGLIKRRYADTKGALAAMQHALSVIQRSGWEQSLYGFDCRVACAQVHYMLNQIGEARAHMHIAAAAAAGRRFESAQAQHYLVELTLQMCDVAAGDAVSKAADDDWAEIAAANSVLIVADVALMRIRRDMRTGRSEHCWQTVESLGVLPADLQADMPDLLWMAVLTGALASRRCLSTLGELLADFRRRMEEQHNAWLSLPTHAMQAVHHLLVDAPDAARSELEALLPHIERCGMVRIVLDWPELLPLLAQSRQPFAHRLLGLANSHGQGARPFGLSKQEMRVLQMLVTDESTATIAHELVIETDTVRKHLVRMFRKMGVHSRQEAVRAARAAGMI